MANEHLNYEQRPDGLLFQLRDGVGCLVRYASPKKVEVELWRADILLPPDQGNINTASFRRRLAESAKIAFNRKDGEDVVPHIAKDIDNVSLALKSRPNDSEDEPTLMETLASLFGGPAPLEMLIKYAKEAGEFFHTPEPEAYATVKVGDHRETYHLRSRAFKLWLRSEYHRRSHGDDGGDGGGPSPVLRQQIISDSISQLEAFALFEGKELDVHTRVAEHDGEFYVDLADPLWRAVRITAWDGWEIISDPPVRFVRHKGMMALPFPTTGGDPAAMRELLNLAGVDGGRNWRLILAWLVQAFKPTGPYPVLVLLGPQGAAKSTTQRLLRMLVDPSQVPLRTLPRDEHNLYIDATSSWVIAVDNVSAIPPWFSDALARLATGGGFSTRQLYENREQELFDAMRPVLLNGIGDIVTKPDLLDRSILINLPAIPRESRKLEREVYAAFDAIAPGFLGYLFDAMSEGLRGRDEVYLQDPPRMADFAAWAVATEEALGSSAAGEFIDAYTGSQDEATETAIESWAPGAAFLEFAEGYPGRDGAWVGSATELLKELNDSVDDGALKRSKEWPKAPNQLTNALNRLAPALLELGVYVERPTHSKREGRKLQIFFVERPDKPSPPPPPPSPDGAKGDTYAESGGDDGGDDGSDGGDGHRPHSGMGTMGDDGGDDGLREDRPQEKPVDKPNAGVGDDGVDGDGGLRTPTGEKVLTVVNVKGRKKGTYSYVGRNEKYGNTYFGNPFEIDKDGTRDEVLELYKPHLASLLATDEGQAELERVRKDVEAGLPLGCHCAGKAELGTPEALTVEDSLFCHAQLVLLELAKSGYEEEF